MLTRSVATLACTLSVLLWAATGVAQIAQIEGLAPPKAAPPPRVHQGHGQDAQDPDGASEDLQKKRRDRRRREDSLAPAPESLAKKREEGLRQDALTPRPRWFMMEVSLVGGTVATSGDRDAYIMNPTSHFGLFWRNGAPAVDGKTGLWYGARVAPFSGTGFHKKRPGTYGLTYFGPMIGVGKVDPVPADDGTPRASSAADADNPAVTGWLVTTGLAAVTRAGKQDGEPEDAATNDFVPKGVTFDTPGVWLEARYLRVLYGGLGVNVVFGGQSGREKTFIYGGVGLAGWY